MFRAKACSGTILPIVEGTTVNTRYGMVRTDFILFHRGGAFHVSKPSDLIPELQGRFPIRVELQSLTVERFRADSDRAEVIAGATVHGGCWRPRGLKLEFTPEAIAEMAQFAFRVNEGTEGAERRAESGPSGGAATPPISFLTNSG